MPSLYGFTSGPWAWEELHDGGWVLMAVVGDMRLELLSVDADGFDRNGSVNRPLMAAGPEMVSVLDVIDAQVQSGTPCPVCAQAPHGPRCALVDALVKAEVR